MGFFDSKSSSSVNNFIDNSTESSDNSVLDGGIGRSATVASDDAIIAGGSINKSVNLAGQKVEFNQFDSKAATLIGSSIAALKNLSLSLVDLATGSQQKSFEFADTQNALATQLITQTNQSIDAAQRGQSLSDNNKFLTSSKNTRTAIFLTGGVASLYIISKLIK